MKVFAQILLIIFFVILFFVGLFSASFKFQILDYNFWQSSLQKHNVYQNLATASKTSFESQINDEGGNENDVKILTDLITSENAKDVVDKNLQSFLSFANGRSAQINVYLPIDKVPTNLLPKSIAGLKSEMPIADLLNKFNFQEWQSLDFQSLSHMGESVTYLFAITMSLLVLIMILLALLVEKGKRFIGIGTALILSGILTLGLVLAGSSLQKVLLTNLMNKPSLSLVFAGVIIPPIIDEVIAKWEILGIFLILLGVCLFFIKKWGYNNRK